MPFECLVVCDWDRVEFRQRVGGVERRNEQVQMTMIGVPDGIKFECPIHKIGVMEIWVKGNRPGCYSRSRPIDFRIDCRF